MHELAERIRGWGRELGFQAVGISDADLSDAEPGFLEWLSKGWHGEMKYMARHSALRAHPAKLKPGTIRVISCRMDYSPTDRDEAAALADGELAYVARYARGRDYHRVVRARLQRLCDRIEAAHGTFTYRVYTDSAPVMEVALAAKAGIGWRGKHTLLLSRDAGSYFFLGEIYTALPLPPDPPVTEHCGSCVRCIDACPTGAIVAPYRLDARRCISYLTIELRGAIPVELRPLIGNRIYGCDDCQVHCPWNAFAKRSPEPDFAVRNGLDAAKLVDLFAWTEEEFHARFAGAPVRRIDHPRWLRNIAVALGNAPRSAAVMAALQARADHPSALVREHVAWALERQATLR